MLLPPGGIPCIFNHHNLCLQHFQDLLFSKMAMFSLICVTCGLKTSNYKISNWQHTVLRLRESKVDQAIWKKPIWENKTICTEILLSLIWKITFWRSITKPIIPDNKSLIQLVLWDATFHWVGCLTKYVELFPFDQFVWSAPPDYPHAFLTIA